MERPNANENRRTLAPTLTSDTSSSFSIPSFSIPFNTATNVPPPDFTDLPTKVGLSAGARAGIGASVAVVAVTATFFGLLLLRSRRQKAAQSAALPEHHPRTDDEKYLADDAPSTARASRAGGNATYSVAPEVLAHGGLSNAPPDTAIRPSATATTSPLDPASNLPEVSYLPPQGVTAVISHLSEASGATGQLIAVPNGGDAPEVVSEIEAATNRAHPTFSDDPEVIHEAGGTSGTAQPGLLLANEEALFDDDEEVRAIQEEQARLQQRRGRLMELERLEEEERRLNQRLEERRMQLRGQR
jgi:hypothetical protein